MPLTDSRRVLDAASQVRAFQKAGKHLQTAKDSTCEETISHKKVISDTPTAGG